MGENNMSINLINYALAKKDWKKAYEDLKVLEIGGRNLLRNSDFRFEQLYYRSWQATIKIVSDDTHNHVLHGTADTSSNFFANTIGRYYNEAFKKGEVYVFSFFAKGNTTIKNIGLGSSGANYYFITNAVGRITLNEEWNYYYVVLEINDNAHKADEQLLLRFEIDAGEIFITKLKLEKGNKATDWTPAPEDINAHPFVAELAETVYRSKQNEERIRNLENAITALGGGS